MSLQDGRQSAAAFDICRGVARLLRAHGMAPVSRGVAGQRAAGRRRGRCRKRRNLDRGDQVLASRISAPTRSGPSTASFATACSSPWRRRFPREILPADTGLIIADRYGGEIVRAAPEHKLAGARRKAMTLRLVHTAAFRLQAAIDPEGRFEEPFSDV